MNDELFSIPQSVSALQLARKRVADAEEMIARCYEELPVPVEFLTELLEAERELQRIEREQINTLRGNPSHSAVCPKSADENRSEARSTERAS